jgi:hypothetical protein
LTLLYIASVHYRSPRWIAIQARHLGEHISVPYKIYSSLEGIDPSYASYFDRVFDQLGPHADKLTHLAIEIAHEAEDDDLLMFLDGDAFPIADPMSAIYEALARAALVAVRRTENLEEPQPHPCFCVTTVGTWRSLAGCWSAGPTWPGPNGKPRSDVGASLLRSLELSGKPWVPLERSNRHNPDPVYFGVYGDIVYHHGAGFRRGSVSAIHRAAAPRPLPVPPVRGVRPLVRAATRRRYKAWERRTQSLRLEQSLRMFQKIESDEAGWLQELI